MNPINQRPLNQRNPKPRVPRRKPSPRRHPLEVTSDRLGDAYERYYHLLDGQELDAISALRFAFEQIADGTRTEDD